MEAFRIILFTIVGLIFIGAGVWSFIKIKPPNIMLVFVCFSCAIVMFILSIPGLADAIEIGKIFKIPLNVMEALQLTF